MNLGAKPSGRIHRRGLFNRTGEGFLTDNVLACLKGCNSDFRVQVVGGGDINDVDFGIVDDAAPVARRALEAKTGRRVRREFIGCFGNDLFDRDEFGRPEKHRHGGIGQ